MIFIKVMVVKDTGTIEYKLYDSIYLKCRNGQISLRGRLWLPLGRKRGINRGGCQNAWSTQESILVSGYECACVQIKFGKLLTLDFSKFLYRFL